jgi:GNAT superfamily N-acetyltransferase
MARVPLRFAAVADTIGWPRALLLAPLWAMSRRFIISDRPLVDLPEVTDPRYPWDELRGEALQELPGLNPLLTPAEIERRVKEGMTCFACRMEGRIVHYRWYATSSVWLPFLGLRWQPEPGDYTSLDVFTAPDLRGKGIHGVLAVKGLRRAQAQGFRRCVSFIAFWNRPSLLVSERIGFRRRGSVTRWGVGPGTFHTSGGVVEVRDRVLRVPPAEENEE